MGIPSQSYRQVDRMDLSAGAIHIRGTHYKHKELTAHYYQASAHQGRVFRKMVEGCAALAALLFGLQFIGEGFGPYEDLYLPMSQAWGPTAWGIIMMSLGLTRGIVLIVNGWWPHTHKIRKYISVAFLFFVWLPLAACFGWGATTDVLYSSYKAYPGLAYSLFTLGTELMVFYAHTSFVLLEQRGDDG